MLRKFAVASFALLLTSSSLSSAQGENQKTEEITGMVVAQGDYLSYVPCRLRCWFAMIVRVNAPDEAKPRYIEVTFKYPFGKFPQRLVERSKEYRFKLIRTKAADTPLNEFVRNVDTMGKELEPFPAWILVPGAEGEKIPFGETLPSYALAIDVSQLIGEK